MKLDHRYKGEIVQQFAAQMEHISPETEKELAALFAGNESADFYAGLLAGLSNALQMYMNGHADSLGVCVAFVASRIQRIQNEQAS